MKQVGAYRNGEYLGKPDVIPSDADHTVGRFVGPNGWRWMGDEEMAAHVAAMPKVRRFQWNKRALLKLVWAAIFAMWLFTAFNAGRASAFHQCSAWLTIMR